MEYTAVSNEKVELSSNDCLHDDYHDSSSWLVDEMNLLDLKLLRHLNLRERFIDFDANTSGYFVSEEEVRSSLNRSVKSQGNHSNPEQDDLLNKKIKELESCLTNKVSDQEVRNCLPLQQICEKFSLDRFETQVLIMALALEIDKKYERIYAYFNDDLNKKSPSIALALSALIEDDQLLSSGHRYFSDEAPLRSYKLIRLVNNHDEDSFLSRRFKLDEGIQNLFLGIDTIHPLLKRIVKIQYPNVIRELSESKAKIKDELRKVLVNNYEQEPTGLVYWLYGKSCIEKRKIVSALCGELDIPLTIVNLEDILSNTDSVETVKLLFREAVLNSTALFFIGGDLLSRDEDRARIFQRFFIKELVEFTWFIFVDAQNLWAPEEYNETLNWCPIEIKAPDFFERRDVWASSFKEVEITLQT